MAKVTVITDRNNRIVGSIRLDPVKIDGGTVQFRAKASSQQKSHDLEIPDGLLGQGIDNLHKEFERMLKSKN
jgi:hypothetical protein